MILSPEVQTAINGQIATAVSVLGGILIAVVAVAGTAGVAYLRKRFHVQENSALGQSFEKAITYGVQLGATQVGKQLAGGQKVQNPLAAVQKIAHDYAAPKVGPMLARLGMTQAELPDRIAARTDPAQVERQIAAVRNLAELQKGA